MANKHSFEAIRNFLSCYSLLVHLGLAFLTIWKKNERKSFSQPVARQAEQREDKSSKHTCFTRRFDCLEWPEKLKRFEKKRLCTTIWLIVYFEYVSDTFVEQDIEFIGKIKETHSVLNWEILGHFSVKIWKFELKILVRWC